MQVKCFNCGIFFSSKFCPNCGAPSQQSRVPQNQYRVNPNQINRPTNHYIYPKPKKKVDGAIVYYLLGFAILCAFMILSQNKSDTLDKDSTTLYKKTEFQKITNTSSEQEESILKILKECGIDKIDSIKHDETLDDMNKENEKGYRVSFSGINNIILYLNSDSTVNIIRYADNNLYIKKKVVSTIQDYTFTLNEQSDLQMYCQKAIKSILKSPSTAKFPNIKKWGFGKQDGEIIVQSYVDSQNSFGAELRSEFQFILSADDYTVKSLIFEGEEYIQ